MLPIELAETASSMRAYSCAAWLAPASGRMIANSSPPTRHAMSDARRTPRRRLAVSAKLIGTIPRLTLSGGVAELTEHDDAKKFFERADEALYRAKSAGKAQLHAND